MNWRVLWVWWMFAALSMPALAGPKAAQIAEARRLSQEMNTLAERNAWKGVERNYVQLISLDGRSVSVSPRDHLLGAQAAEQRGSMFDVWRRLRAAQEAGFDGETARWLATIETSFDRVVIEVSPVFAEVPFLEARDMGFDPAAQRTIAAARESLASRRGFDGLLPLGRYHIDATEFEVLGLGELQRVVVRPVARRPVAARPVDPQASPGTSAAALIRLAVGADDLDGFAFDGAAAAVSRSLTALHQVQAVQIDPLPAPQLYVDYSESTLEMLGVTSDFLRTAIAAQTETYPAAITVGPGWLGVPLSVGRATLAELDIEVEGGAVTLSAFTQVREGPDRAAPPPGLTLTLDTTADLAEARAVIGATLQTEPSAEVLQLVLITE